MRKLAPFLFVLFAFYTAGFAAAAPPDATALVDPFLGTSTTPDGSDVIDDFPGADVPFGMVQWSPDTPSQNAGGGYEYNDHEITGFSLTHLSGPGCSVFGDFSILPTTGTITDPAHAKQPFSHATESATPGFYAVTLGDPAIRSQITVTKRTGLAQFTFPQTSQANLLFNVASDQAGVRNAGFRIVNAHRVEGFADTGGFCGMPNRYSVYFVADFDTPIVSSGVWHNADLSPGATSVQGAGSGGWVTFDASSSAIVKVKVGLSFVDTAGALANLQRENRGWNVDAVRSAALSAWQSVLQRIDVSGGTAAEQREFYTAFYHAMLHPNVFSDADGRYPGFDRKPHHARRGHQEYANFSDWDIYRTLVPLQALLAPKEVSDMMQSLVDAARQDVFLPRWALVNGATSVMGGDSVDPVIAGAFAFGARSFDLHGALGAMLKGASDLHAPAADGWYVERPELAEYLQHGYIVNTHTTSVSPVPNGGSETLEYALDDFSIAQFAKAIGAHATYREYMRRSSNWANLFDTSIGLIAPRDADGAFMQTPITSAGQSGFQEGNAAQYTWMVPQDLRDLIAGMGGTLSARQRLDTFFTQINAGQDKPYAWLGNEPTLGSPWVYLSAGAPWRAQQIVRQSLTTMFADTPHGIPGNDDLGTMSAWYMWGAMGLYPQNPSVRLLDVGSPLFTNVTIHSPAGLTISIRAPQAEDAAPFVQALRVNGRSTAHAWLTLPMHGAVNLDFTLASTPDSAWGSGAGDVPPSFALAPVHFLQSTTATLAYKNDSARSVSPGGSAMLHFSIAAGALPASVSWQTHAPPGFSVAHASGAQTLAANDRADVTLSVTAGTQPGLYDIPVTASASNGALLQKLILPVRVAAARHVLSLAWIENRFDNTVMPFDPVTHAIGAQIPAGQEPRDAVLSADGRFLYVANRGGKSVTVIDTIKESISATVKVGNSPNGTAISPDGRTIFVANYDDSTLQAIDTRTLKAGKAVSTGLNPRYVAVSRDNRTVYVSNQNGNTVSTYAWPSLTPEAVIPVGAHPSGIAITPDGSMAFVANSGSNDVTPIDLISGKALQPIPAGYDASMIAISPDGKVAYVSDFATTTISVIDIRTRTARAPIQVGGAPYGIAFTADSKTALVVLRRDSAVVPVDVATGRVGRPIQTGSSSPYTIALP
jgi:predicted alpha-1,2-mannosidase